MAAWQVGKQHMSEPHFTSIPNFPLVSAAFSVLTVLELETEYVTRKGHTKPKDEIPVSSRQSEKETVMNVLKQAVRTQRKTASLDPVYSLCPGDVG